MSASLDLQFASTYLIAKEGEVFTFLGGLENFVFGKRIQDAVTIIEIPKNKLHLDVTIINNTEYAKTFIHSTNPKFEQYARTYDELAGVSQ